MRLPGSPEQWPDEWKFRYLERLAIMEESRVPDAPRKAAEDTRRQAATWGGIERRQSALTSDTVPLSELRNGSR